MIEKRLGATGPVVSQIGLGLMGMSELYGPTDEAESIATIHAALDAGITLLDTGDFYGMGHNELLLRRALDGVARDSVQISVKFGGMRDPAGGWVGMDCRPAAVKNFLTYSLRRLGTDYVDIYRPARLDASVPIEETVGAIGEMISAGYVRHVGLSEIGADTLRRAQAIQPVVDVQIEYSLISRSVEAAILPACRELGVGITAYGVLSRGLLSGGWSKQRSEAKDFRGNLPRFSGENLDRNLELVERLRLLAHDKGVTVAQLAVAWVLAQDSLIVPLIGSRRRTQLAEALDAIELALTADDLRAIEAAIPHGSAAGERYSAVQMAHLDSERGNVHEA